MGNKIVFLSRVVDFEILCISWFFLWFNRVNFERGKIRGAIFLSYFLLHLEGVKDIYRWGKGWNMTRKLDTLSSLYHSGNDERLSRERDTDRWQNVQAFSSRILDILERNDPDNEDSYWWEKCDWKLILYSPGKKISFLKNCLDSWNSWLRYIPTFK